MVHGWAGRSGMACQRIESVEQYDEGLTWLSFSQSLAPRHSRTIPYGARHTRRQQGSGHEIPRDA